MHSGSLDSAQEGRVALSYRLVQLLFFTQLSCSPNFPRASIERYTLSMNKFLNILTAQIFDQDCSRLAIRTHLHERRGLIQA